MYKMQDDAPHCIAAPAIREKMKRATRECLRQLASLVGESPVGTTVGEPVGADALYNVVSVTVLSEPTIVVVLSGTVERETSPESTLPCRLRMSLGFRFE